MSDVTPAIEELTDMQLILCRAERGDLSVVVRAMANEIESLRAQLSEREAEIERLKQDNELLQKECGQLLGAGIVKLVMDQEPNNG